MRKRIFTMALLASLAAPAQAQAYKPDAVSGSWAPPGVSCDSDQSLFRMTERIMWKGVPAMGAIDTIAKRLRSLVKDTIQ